MADATEFGWFHYDSGQRLPRTSNDARIIAAPAADGTWVIDDADHGVWRMHGLTADQIEAACKFAVAMGWLDSHPDRAVTFRPRGEQLDAA